MDYFWLKFQGSSAELFSKIISLLPGSDLVKLLLSSALLGIILVWLYSFVSFQKSLAKLKKRIGTVVYEPFLFSDSARISLLTPLKLLGFGAKYLALSLPPILILAGPVIWAMGLWNQVIGFEKVQNGQQLVVSIDADSSRSIRQLQVSVEGQGFIMSPLVRTFHESRAWAGLSQTTELADNYFVISSGTTATRIPLNRVPILPVLTNSVWKRLLFPGSNLELPKGLNEVSFSYPERHFDILGTNVHWAILFLLVSMISGFIFAKKFKIQV